MGVGEKPELRLELAGRARGPPQLPGSGQPEPGQLRSLLRPSPRRPEIEQVERQPVLAWIVSPYRVDLRGRRVGREPGRLVPPPRAVCAHSPGRSFVVRLDGQGIEDDLLAAQIYPRSE